MISIISSNLKPQYLEELQNCFLSEWGQVEPNESSIEGNTIPSPLLAIEAKKLIGGLAFTVYPKPKSKEKGLWINAVWVQPKNRGFGIASKLILAAEIAASEFIVKELFVYTNIPNLYKNLNWLVVSSDDKNTVLSRNLKK